MPFEDQLRSKVINYCKADLPPRKNILELFSYIEDADLRNRIVSEYEGARFAYKLFEGIRATDDQMRFQVRSQLLSYASLYEASVEYVLFHYYEETEEVAQMGRYKSLIKISIPESQKEKLQNELSHNGKEIIPCYEGTKRKDRNTIRFDEKVDAAVKLGLLHSFHGRDPEVVNLPDELKEIYGFRNGIHIIAEQRKDINYEIDMSKKAYWRIAPFCQQIREGLERDGKWHAHV